ncbi:hypothetical protein [Herbaspirillum camelliae]|uniref:hypothetical protein n=1 Tax=Herbaspirillum camelliae TaxID=1892903 RepID=UPI00117A679A|nr:hypothetical protein [Herbaspirillum camelliae]
MASVTAGCEHRLAIARHPSPITSPLIPQSSRNDVIFLRLYLKAKKQQIIFYLFMCFAASFCLGAIFTFLHKFDAASAVSALL